METLGNNKLRKSCDKFYCKKCDYYTDRKSSYDKHILTDKHVNIAHGNKNATLETQSCEKLQNYTCIICQKEFTNRSGLWKHKQKCDINSNKLTEIDKDDLIITLLKQNADLIKGQQDMIIKLTENGIGNNSHNTTNTNSHNKAFNLNFFLNETCKNAMNITDFVDSIKLQLPDLIDVGELGYVEGISKIIVNNLNNLDETERPIHCTDKKRETMYIKDEDTWQKEDEKKSKLKKAVKTIANKNIRLLSQFREKYPDYENSSSKTSDTYDKIVIEAMTSDDMKNEKIIKNISNVTVIKE